MKAVKRFSDRDITNRRGLSACKQKGGKPIPGECENGRVIGISEGEIRIHGKEVTIHDRIRIPVFKKNPIPQCEHRVKLLKKI